MIVAVGVLAILVGCAVRAVYFLWRGWHRPIQAVSEREAAENAAPLSSAVMSVAPKQSPHRAHRGF